MMSYKFVINHNCIVTFKKFAMMWTITHKIPQADIAFKIFHGWCRIRVGNEP